MVCRKTILLICTLLQFFQTVGGNSAYLEYTASAGATVEFGCKNTHTLFHKVIWRRNDSLQIVAEKGVDSERGNYTTYNGNYTNRLIFQGKNLIISDCQGFDHGFYFCETTYKGERRRGGYYKFVVEEKPKCDRAVTDINVLNGTSGFLPCFVRGEPKPSYVWKKKVGQFEFVDLNERFTPSTRGLKINSVDENDAGTYMVTLTNRLGIFKQRLRLHVKTRNTIKAKNYHDIIFGCSVMLNCEKYTIEKGTTIEWIDSSGSDAALLDGFTVIKNGSLVIKNVQLTDDGLYTCKKRTKTDKGIWLNSVLIYLNVQFAPVITTIKSNVKVYKNSHILIICETKGNPSPHPRWYLPDGTVARSNKKYEVLSNGSLIVRNVQLTDVMNYTCAPYNSVGTTNKSTHLSVIVPPYFVGEQVQIIRARVGEHVKINCQADGLPKPSVSWSYVNKSTVEQRKKLTDSGELTIKDIQRSGEGFYVCVAESSAGKSVRQVQLIVMNKPHTPKDFFVITQNGSMYFSWKPSYNGGVEQTFEVWYRATYKSDYEWSSVGVISNQYKIHLDDTDAADQRDVSFYCSLRSQNSEGYSDFTHVVKTAKLLPHGGKLRSTTLESGLSHLPLAPYKFTVDITTEGYILEWKYIPTPGRPAASKFLIVYRQRNSSQWKAFVQKERVRRALNAAKVQQNIVNIKREDIPGTTHPLQFQVSSITPTDVKSKPAVPTVNDVRTIVIAGRATSTSKVNLIPPIVMAIIFGLFTVILVVGLYCYCNRKKKRLGSMEESKINLVANDNNNMNIDRNSFIKSDNSKLPLPLDYTRYHLRSCPALKLGESNQTADRNKPDDVFVLLKPNPNESVMCTCSKNLVAVNTLGHSKKDDKNRPSLYKSTSLPSVLLTSDPDISSDLISVDQSELLDERDFGIVNVKKDCDINKPDKDAVTLLQRGGMFRDSYDKFCRSDSTLRRPNAKAEATKGGTLNKLPETEVSSETPIDKTEHSPLPCKVSDDDTETKSIKSNKSIKSSGFGDGESSTSDPDSILLETLGTPTQTHKSDNLRLLDTPSKKDIGYFSDVPTGVSPLLSANQNIHPAQKHKVGKSCKHSGYYSEDDSSSRTPYRPLAPPPYNQAIMDIERMSDSTTTDVTDSENMCKQLLELERQMGVTLDDSIDSHLDKRHILDPPSRFQNSSYRDTGYMSDIGSSTIKTKYTNREKNIRCAQLLNEFKNNKQKEVNMDEVDLISSDSFSSGFDPKHTLRSISLMESVISEELPSLKRCNSTNNNTCNEWLV